MLNCLGKWELNPEGICFQRVREQFIKYEKKHCEWVGRINGWMMDGWTDAWMDLYQ